MGPFFKAPECVRDYDIFTRIDGVWEKAVAVEGNFHRKRVHRFDAVVADAIRINVTATNGGPSARIYEVRIYSR